ncbi:MAG: CoA-binding protein [Acidobacteriota bacterium]
MTTSQPISLPTVAVLGASADRRKFGNKSVRAHVDAGYRVLPIHPMAESIEGLPAFPDLAALQLEHLDRISVYLPPAVTERLLDQIAEQPADAVWFNPGSATSELVAAARAKGIEAISGCSIVDLGRSPSQYPD